jgi:arylformamidase
VRIYDVTVPISEMLPVWPGDPRVQIEPLTRIAKGDSANVSVLRMGTHTGTHVDAPYHYIQQGLTVDKLPLDVLMGPAFIAEIDAPQGSKIGVWELARLHFPRDITRLLIKTKNSYLWEDRVTEFERVYCHLAPHTAEWLVKGGIRLVGVDYLSVEGYGSGDHRVHQTLLEAGVIIIEGLDLSRVPEGPCQLVCLPLRIQGGDGAPARVLVIRD